MLEMVASIPETHEETFWNSPPIVRQDEPASLVSYTIPWPDVSLIEFLRQAANAPRVYWESQKAAISFAGCGITAKLTAHGPDRFQTIRQAAHKLFNNTILLNKDGPHSLGPRLFGGFSFRKNYEPNGLWRVFPAACFILPRYQLTHFNGRMWLTINHRLGPEDDPMGIEYLLREEVDKFQQTAATPTSGNDLAAAATPNQRKSQPEISDLMEPATWRQLVSEATQRIRQGELDKVVLARARQMRSPNPIDPATILTRLQTNYPNCYRFLFEPVPGHAFYGATPELLADVTGSSLHTVALAGSIRRGQSPEEDAALGRQLLNTPKEQIEHAHVVEAIEENLQPLVTSLRVASEPGLCRLSNIQHIQTTIEGQLPAGCDTLTVVEALHPTPALGGRPRRVALPLINRMESVSRGWYGAPIGWLDQQHNGMFAVAIRSAVSVGNESMLFAGAGIVADSEPDKEWRETQLKFKPLMDALNGRNQS